MGALMQIDSNLIGIGASALVMLLGLAATWGSLRNEVKGIHHRLDRMNGRLDRHSERLDGHGERIAHLEGGHAKEGD